MKMKFIDQNFLQQELSYPAFGYLSFIEWSIIEIIKENSENRSNSLNINSTEFFWLFSYIKNNFRSTLAHFYNYDIESDILGFPTVQRELRHSIEAFLDLYNLVTDENYKCVLSYCSNSNREERIKIDLGKYKKFLFNKEFTIQSKYNISKLNKKDLMKMAKATNSYTHPDVYLDINKVCNNKEEMLISLIKMNVYLISESYSLFIKGINSYGATTCLLNNNVIINGLPHSYKDLYQQKLLSLNKFIQNSLIITLPAQVF